MQMERELSREEFYTALAALGKSMDAGFAGVNVRLDRLNGKTERHGEDIAVLKAVQQSERDEPTRSGRKDSAIGAGVAAGAFGIIELVKAIWK
jgi:hypothetical protein